jgi:hypothetical protein
MSRLWAFTATAFVALVAPFYSSLMLNNATEPWMVLFVLLSLWTTLKGRYVAAGALVGVAFFFRAQIISIIPAILANASRWGVKSVFRCFLGCCITYLAGRLVLASGFYSRAFFEKYDFSLTKGLSVAGEDIRGFRLLYLCTSISAAMYIICRLFYVRGVARQSVEFFALSTAAMVGFAFYMACTVGGGVSDRYFVHLICLFWISAFLVISERVNGRAWLVRPIAPLFLCGVMFLYGSVQIDAASLRSNLFAEDMPEHFFKGVSAESIVIVGAGAAVLSLHANPRRLAQLPPLDVFQQSPNTNADFIFLHSARGRVPDDWGRVWDVEEFSDVTGVTFKLVSRYDSPLRTSRLFKRISS